MKATVHLIDSVTPYGDNLSIVRVAGQQVIANREDDGSLRWAAGEMAVYVEEGSILPEDVLKERGYWDVERDRGYLDGGPRNRVKARKMGPAKEPTVGLLFKIRAEPVEDDIVAYSITRGNAWRTVEVGQDVTDFFDITSQ